MAAAEPRAAWQPHDTSSGNPTNPQGLILPDISQGSERIPIRVINTIDDLRPAPFKYVTKIIYPPGYGKEPPTGCDCTNGCSDSVKCTCALRDGGELPYNFNGAEVEVKPLIYECGPWCRCPPTCHNRAVSYASLLVRYYEIMKLKRENDEYLFDIGHNYFDGEPWERLELMIQGPQSPNVSFTIDAAECRNVGRFINHSCSPNLCAQNVLWDHDDMKMPHIMFFAIKDIPPLQELTYHYNYAIGQVRDENGEEKVKHCYCGSYRCCGRLY